jgi:hypothetical protein
LTSKFGNSLPSNIFLITGRHWRSSGATSAGRCGRDRFVITTRRTQPIAHAMVVMAKQYVGGRRMARRRKRRYSRSAGSDVKSEMHRYKRGTARSGRGGRGGTVKSRKQAIAIGLSKARKKGKKVPKKRA